MVSNYNFNPGVTNFIIGNLNENGVLSLKKDSETRLEFQITLTGIPLLKGYFDDQSRAKYFYAFLVFASPEDFEIISSIDSPFLADPSSMNNITIHSKLTISTDQVFECDFVNSYYYLIISVTDTLPEDGSDINTLATDNTNALLYVKVLTEIEG